MAVSAYVARHSALKNSVDCFKRVQSVQPVDRNWHDSWPGTGMDVATCNECSRYLSVDSNMHYNVLYNMPYVVPYNVYLMMYLIMIAFIMYTARQLHRSYCPAT